MEKRELGSQVSEKIQVSFAPKESRFTMEKNSELLIGWYLKLLYNL